MSWVQWRLRMAGWCSSDTSGSDVSIAFSASSSILPADAFCVNIHDSCGFMHQ